MQEQEDSVLTASMLEQLLQATQANLQLLAVLEVLHQWDRTDPDYMVAAAAHMEAAAVGAVCAGEPQASADAVSSAVSALALLGLRLDGLANVVARKCAEPAIANASLLGLRRLQAAHSLAQTQLRGFAVRADA